MPAVITRLSDETARAAGEKIYAAPTQSSSTTTTLTDELVRSLILLVWLKGIHSNTQPVKSRRLVAGLPGSWYPPPYHTLGRPRAVRRRPRPQAADAQHRSPPLLLDIVRRRCCLTSFVAAVAWHRPPPLWLGIVCRRHSLGAVRAPFQAAQAPSQAVRAHLGPPRRILEPPSSRLDRPPVH